MGAFGTETDHPEIITEKCDVIMIGVEIGRLCKGVAFFRVFNMGFERQRAFTLL
jgi:hypothetical protein